MTAEEIVSRVLYRDALMLVIDKPAGLPVHPGPKGGETLVHHLDALRFGLPRRPEAAHRLDRDTAGCLVLGRHPKALARLGELFKANTIEKTYWAVVEGGPEAESGTIDLPIGPQSRERPWWMKVDPKGQPALTRWRVLGRADGRALLELRPITGRTHQLRVHCAARGWPIHGDTLYGTAPRAGGPGAGGSGAGGSGLHLLARAVTVPLYPNKTAIHVEAPVPGHMVSSIRALGIG
jgi:tRNA pseudouridine32 synthase / 23S rRNA pseudouridine746 synthase